MRIGIKSCDFGKHTTDELARIISGKGFDSIQLSLPDSISDIDVGPGKLSPGMANHIRKTFSSYGIRIAALECYINPIVSDEVERKRQIGMFKEHIRYTRDFGCSTISTATGSLNADFSFNEKNYSEETFQALLCSMNEMVEEAEKFGVMICIEGDKAYCVHSAQRIRRLLDEIDSNNLQVLYDPVDLLTMDTYKDQDNVIKESFDLFGDRIAIFHAKDYMIENNCVKSVQPGNGRLNYELLFKLLKSRKPYIDIIMEHIDPEIVDKGISYIKGIYDSVK